MGNSGKKTVRPGVAGPNHEATGVKGIYRRSTSDPAPGLLLSSLTTRDPDEVFVARPHGRMAGQWLIGSEATHPSPVTVNGVTTRRGTTGGDPRTNAVMLAVVNMFTEAEREAAVAEAYQLAETGQPMTALVVSGDGRDVTAMEMKGSVPNPGTPLSAIGTMKGDREQWHRLSYLNILSVEPGYGKQRKLAALFEERAALAPAVGDPEG